VSVVLIVCGILWANPDHGTVVRVCYAQSLLHHRRVRGMSAVDIA
jgi:hypothetical protein